MSIEQAKLPATPAAAFAQLRQSVEDFKTQAGKTLDALRPNLPVVDHYIAEAGHEDSCKYVAGVNVHSELERAIATLNATYGEAALMDPTAIAAMLGRKGAIEFASKKAVRARELTEELKTIERGASLHTEVAGVAKDIGQVLAASAHSAVVLEAVTENTEAVVRYLEKSGAIASVEAGLDRLRVINANTRTVVNYLQDRLAGDFEHGQKG